MNAVTKQAHNMRNAMYPPGSDGYIVMYHAGLILLKPKLCASMKSDLNISCILIFIFLLDSTLRSLIRMIIDIVVFYFRYSEWFIYVQV